MPKFSFIRSRVVFLFAAVQIVYTAVYRSIPFELAVTTGFGLKFEFERYLAVYRGRNRYRWLAVRIERWVKKPWLKSHARLTQIELSVAELSLSAQPSFLLLSMAMQQQNTFVKKIISSFPKQRKS
jgi:hypothetical protein